MTTVASDFLVALALGGMLGLGLWALCATIPLWSAPSLARRIAPYIRDVTDPAGTSLPPAHSFDPAAGMMNAARWGSNLVRERVSRWVGGAATLRDRLDRAGWGMSVDSYRGRQLTVALAAAGCAIVVAAILTTREGSSPALWLLTIVAAIAGFLGCDAVLTRAIAARRARVEDELPTILDFLALCLSAGESLPDALSRTSEIGSGVLAKEMRRLIVETRTGSPLSAALTAWGARLGVPAVTRVVDHLVAAVERGAPLAGLGCVPRRRERT